MMKLDLRQATIVLTGAWNPDIFAPPWIARYLFDFAEGDEVTFDQVFLTSNNEPPKQVTYIDKIGISATKGRIELFANAFGQDDMRHLESVAKKIISTLLHTPLGAMGVNFAIIDESPTGDLADKLKSPDGIEGKFDIKSQSFVSTIALEDQVDLRLTRTVTGDSISFGFNYHSAPLNVDNADRLLDGSVDARYQQTQGLLKSLYDLEGIEFLTHNNPTGV